MSRSTLKRILNKMDLRRKNLRESNMEKVCGAAVSEMRSVGMNLGYKALHRKPVYCHGLVVKRDTVYNIIRKADPEGVRRRKARHLVRRMFWSPGPNYTWHIDGYDKLKNYGFFIHGAIDGFSRYIL
ncbi:hypothetical protein QAD02_013729 [Eretmocerus hayati]|uniref:Uncharacterized protein n=1 Tax=Eretmocerus hayati TaxID=131215 RepID=A0ACC2P3J8_9HYME|nr:hypothetical protein QAD02_013729 [Eretmocerus hayati]